MAHRFIVGESPRAALDTISAPVARRHRRVGRPAGRGDGDARRGRPLRRALRRGARSTLARRRSTGRERDVARTGHGRADPAGQPVGEGHGADAADAAARRPSSAATTPPSGCGRCCAARATSAPTCTSTWSRSTRSRPRRSSSSSLLAEDEFAAGPSAGIVLQAYLRDSPAQLDTAARVGALAPARLAARRPPGQGRLLGPRGGRGAPARLEPAGVRAQGRLRPQLRGAHAPRCSTRGRSCG